MKKVICLLGIALLLQLESKAQHIFKKIIGDSTLNESAKAIVESADGSFYVAGDAEYSGKGREVILMKLDSVGNILWTKSYGGPTSVANSRFDDFATKLILSQNGQNLFIIGHSSKKNATTNVLQNRQSLAISVQLNGTLNWMKRYGTGVNTNRALSAIEQNNELWMFGYYNIDTTRIKINAFRVYSNTGILCPNGPNAIEFSDTVSYEMGLGTVINQNSGGGFLLGSRTVGLTGNPFWMYINGLDPPPFTPRSNFFIHKQATDTRYWDGHVNQNDEIIATGYKTTILSSDPLTNKVITRRNAFVVKYDAPIQYYSLRKEFALNFGTVSNYEESIGSVSNLNHIYICGNRRVNGEGSVFLTQMSNTGSLVQSIELSKNSFLSSKSNCIIHTSDGRIIVVGTIVDTNSSEDIYIHAIKNDLTYACELPILNFQVNPQNLTDSILEPYDSSHLSMTTRNLFSGGSLSYNCEILCSNLYNESYKVKCPQDSLELDGWEYVNQTLYTPSALNYKWEYYDSTLGWVEVSGSRFYKIIGPQAMVTNNLYRLIITHEDSCKAKQIVTVDDRELVLPDLIIDDVMCVDESPGAIINLPQDFLNYLLHNWEPGPQAIQGIILDWGDPNHISSISIGDLNAYLQSPGGLNYHYTESGDYTISISIVTPCSTYTVHSNTFQVRYNPQFVISQLGDCPNFTLRADMANNTFWNTQDFLFEWYDGSTIISSGYGVDEYAISVYCQEFVCLRVISQDSCITQACVLIECKPEVSISADKQCGNVTLTANLTLADPATSVFSWYDYDVSSTFPVAQGLSITQLSVFNDCYKKIKVVVTPNALYEDCPTEAEIELRCTAAIPTVEFSCENGEIVLKVLPDGAVLDEYAGVSNIEIIKFSLGTDSYDGSPPEGVYNGPLNANTISPSISCSFAWLFNFKYTICINGVYDTIEVNEVGVPRHIFDECCNNNPFDRLKSNQSKEINPTLIYPNPVRENLFIELSLEGEARVISIDGQELLGNVQLKEGINEVDISLLPKGIYLIEIQTGKGLLVNKFLKD